MTKSFIHLLLCVLAIPAYGKHAITLDDAFDIKSVGEMAASPDGRLLALETGRGILVIPLARPKERLKTLVGYSPSWSPDGRQLAFFANGEDGTQVYVWNVQSNLDEQITHIPGGISPNPWFGLGCDANISWAPDSTRVTFASRLTGEPRNTTLSREHDGMRIYDSKAPIDHTLIEGVFKRESFWEGYGAELRAPGDSELNRMKAIDLAPELTASRLVIADVRQKTWVPFSKGDAQYSCPSWSPNGKHIAAVTERGHPYKVTYFGHLHLHATGLAVFDVASDRVRQLTTPTTRVGGPRWASDSDRLVAIAETKPLLSSFTRVLTYSLSRDESSLVPTPVALAALDVRWSVDGKTLLAQLSDRFVDSWWQLKPGLNTARKIETYDWQIDSLAQMGVDTFLLNAQSASFKGRVVISAGDKKALRTVYDANPQVSELNLGPQRRITWKNRAGEDVDGILILPPDYRQDRRYPVIVNPYPSLARDRFWLHAQYENTGQLTAARGYVVFRPNLRVPQAIAHRYPRGENYLEKARGASGIPIMVDDFVAGIDFLIQSGIADADRIGMFGHSNGGWATNLLVTETSLVRAAVVSSGISNAIMLSFFPIPMITRGADPATNGNVFDNFNDYVKLSPIFKMRDTRTAMLLTVGDQDWIWIPQMIAQYGVLRSEGKDVQLIRYSNEGHSLRDRRSIEDALNRMNAFFDEHLKGGVIQ